MCYALDMAIGERCKVVSFEKIEYARVQQAHGNADVALVVEAVSWMNTPISIFGVVVFERLQDSQLNLGRVSVFLDRSNNLQGDVLLLYNVVGFDDFAKGALPEQFLDSI